MEGISSVWIIEVERVSDIKTEVRLASLEEVDFATLFHKISYRNIINFSKIFKKRLTWRVDINLFGAA